MIQNSRNLLKILLSTQPPHIWKEESGWITFRHHMMDFFAGCFNKQTSIKMSKFIWGSWRLVIFKPKLMLISAYLHLTPHILVGFFSTSPVIFERNPPNLPRNAVVSKRRLGWKHWGPGSSCIARCDSDPWSSPSSVDQVGPNGGEVGWWRTTRGEWEI